MRSIRTLVRRSDREFGSRGVLSAAGLLALALAVACGGDESTAPMTGEAVVTEQIEIDLPEEPGEPSAATVRQNELPAEYPKDLPTYPGATPSTSMLVPGGAGMIVFSSDGAVEEVTAFFAEALPEQGWDVETSEDGTRLQATKGGRSATVTVEPGDAGAQIAIVISGA